MDINNLNSMTDYASKLASSQNSKKLQDSVKNAESEAEMLDACKEFETYLWEQVIKSMKKSAEVFSGEEDKNMMVDYHMDSAITETARQLTEQSLGPNSLAMQMFEQMKRNVGGLTIEEVLKKQEEEQAAVTEDGNA
ncbi:MAG: hypothetical protein IKI75_06835 [Lachnospiraceae bacterium]|nr:hypothetical protein [Lachnospiraceae bacterium]